MIRGAHGSAVALAVCVVAAAAVGLGDGAACKGAGAGDGGKALVKETPPPAAPDSVAGKVRLTPWVKGLNRPVGLVVAPGETRGRIFVVEQWAKIRIVRTGAGGAGGAGAKVDEKAFLDLSSEVSRGNEQGLLGLAFHPRFADNGKLYVDYTDKHGDTHVVEYRVAKDAPDQVDVTTAREVFFLEQPYSNHNGGNLVFGPDGKLWVGTGDGGSANDPHGNGQNPKVHLAKMLRIDVDAEKPIVDVQAIGLRNPWRYSFDRKTGDLYIADVGQNLFEEVDVVAAGRIEKGGLNFGWNVMEGLHCFQADKCDQKGLELPVVEYNHRTGCSITGGSVYRGKNVPAIEGIYFYADFCTGVLRGFRWSGGKGGGVGAVTDHWDWKPALDPKHKLANLSAFGEDADGELYLLSLDGVIYRFESAGGVAGEQQGAGGAGGGAGEKPRAGDAGGGAGEKHGASDAGGGAGK